jgi:hypothetical protein
VWCGGPGGKRHFDESGWDSKLIDWSPPDRTFYTGIARVAPGWWRGPRKEHGEGDRALVGSRPRAPTHGALRNVDDLVSMQTRTLSRSALVSLKPLFSAACGGLYLR